MQLAKVERQINEYQYEIKRLLNEKDESKNEFTAQVESLTRQLRNLESEKEIESEVSELHTSFESEVCEAGSCD
jgi:hypothetical protein